MFRVPCSERPPASWHPDAPPQDLIGGCACRVRPFWGNGLADDTSLSPVFPLAALFVRRHGTKLLDSIVAIESMFGTASFQRSRRKHRAARTGIAAAGRETGWHSVGKLDRLKGGSVRFSMGRSGLSVHRAGQASAAGIRKDACHGAEGPVSCPGRSCVAVWNEAHTSLTFNH